MKIALLGATGKVGRHTLTEAVAAGHHVIAYARRADAVEKLPGVSAVQGAIEDTAALTDAITSADALVVAITGPIKDTTFAQRTLPAILDAASEAGVARLVLVSAFGAGDTADKASGFARLIYRTVLKGFLADKAVAERLLAGSGLNWTTVYPVNLKDGPAHPDWSAVPLDKVRKVPGLPTLPFGNVARTLVELATDTAPTGRRVLVTTAKGWRSV